MSALAIATERPRQRLTAAQSRRLNKLQAQIAVCRQFLKMEDGIYAIMTQDRCTLGETMGHVEIRLGELMREAADIQEPME